MDSCDEWYESEFDDEDWYAEEDDRGLVRSPSMRLQDDALPLPGPLSTLKALRGKEVTGLAMCQRNKDDFTPRKVEKLLTRMYNDVPTGGVDLVYGEDDSQKIRFWKAKSPNAPIIVFIHGGSWESGTYLDSIGSAKVTHLINQGYAFASVDFPLVPFVTVQEQVEEVAGAVAHLVDNATDLEIDPKAIVLMGHSSGAHIVTLLGTDTSYLEDVEVDIDAIRGVIAIDGSNYNAMAELIDNPGQIANNMLKGLGKDPEELEEMSPTHHARGPNANAFLLLHVQRHGDVRQAIEFSTVLKAVGTTVDLHVFEGYSFEGHIEILLRLGDPTYPATSVMDDWLEVHVPALTLSASTTLVETPVDNNDNE